MQSDDIDYDTYLDGRFALLSHVRSFGPWELLSASHAGAPVLLLVNDEVHSATLCLYETREERGRDAAWACEIPPDGDAGAEFPARLRPSPPTLSAGNARALPDPDTKVDDAPAQHRLELTPPSSA